MRRRGCGSARLCERGEDSRRVKKGVQESGLEICVRCFYLACPVRETFFWVYNYSGLLAAVSHLPNFVSTAMPHLHIVDCTKRVCL